MKMSMFDVSDVENPKEMFSVDIGENYTSSEITYNHKALFYHKNRKTDSICDTNCISRHNMIFYI